MPRLGPCSRALRYWRLWSCCFAFTPGGRSRSASVDGGPAGAAKRECPDSCEPLRDRRRKFFCNAPIRKQRVLAQPRSIGAPERWILFGRQHENEGFFWQKPRFRIE